MGASESGIFSVDGEANRAPNPTGALAGAGASESGIFSVVGEGNRSRTLLLDIAGRTVVAVFRVSIAGKIG